MRIRHRLDKRVLELGLAPSREAAQAAIIDGGIFVDGLKATKPGMPVGPEAKITLAPSWGAPRYASRGGLKLEKALEHFAVVPNGLVCLDIGASTGGFTDCLLKHGASRVYAVDVGYGQLDWSLRQDFRVSVKERINARYLSPPLLYQPGDNWAQLGVIDVSFISLGKILPPCMACLDPGQRQIICLIKPQFEAGRDAVGKGGVVRSPEAHFKVLEDFLDNARSSGLAVAGITHSPLKGPAGNLEYLAHLLPAPFTPGEIDLKAVVADCFQELSP